MISLVIDVFDSDGARAIPHTLLSDEGNIPVRFSLWFTTHLVSKDCV